MRVERGHPLEAVERLAQPLGQRAQVFVGEVGYGNDVGVYGHLYGVSPDVPRGSDDHYRMSAHRVCILEQHLPGGYRNDGS